MRAQGKRAHTCNAYDRMRRDLLPLLRSDPDRKQVLGWFEIYDDWKRRAFLDHNPDLIPRVRRVVGDQDWIPDPNPTWDPDLTWDPGSRSEEEAPGYRVSRAPVTQGRLPPAPALDMVTGSLKVGGLFLGPRLRLSTLCS